MGAIDRPARRRTCRENDALVLGLLGAADGPVSAYDIAEMARLSGTHMVSNQVYRTMVRLMAQRMVRRVETLNAYLPWTSTADLCLVCAQCHAVEWIEWPSLAPLLAEAMAGTGFRPSVRVVEVLGQCPDCLTAGNLEATIRGNNVQ